MMTTTIETPNALKSPEHLKKLFHILMTRTMYTKIENLSVRLSISKGALIRFALEDYFRKMDEEDTIDYFRKMDDENSLEHQDLESQESFWPKRETNNQQSFPK
jgi:hypothetical protein